MPSAMPATELAQLRVIERLRTERHPGDAGATESDGIAALIGARVRLDRDLGIGRQSESLPDASEDALHLVDREERRRAAAQVDRLERRAPARPRAAPGRPERGIQCIGS
jgi:hypothetical protein